MRNNVLLLIGIIVLYLAISLVLQGIYGPSYGFLAGEDCWRPDGNGGWVMHGAPSDSAPDQPSVNVPVIVRYLPNFVPGLVLILFLFTPLSRLVEKRPEPEPEPESAETRFDADDSAAPPDAGHDGV